jgi:hypothetical protein
VANEDKTQVVKNGQKPDTTTVVATRALAGIIRTIADHRDCTMAEVLDRYARPGLLLEYKQVLEEMSGVFDGTEPAFANTLGGEG